MSEALWPSAATRPVGASWSSPLAQLLDRLAPRPVAEAAPAPEPPAPDLDAIRRAAHVAGYDEGFTAGHAAGRAEAEAALAPLRADLAEAAAALSAACAIDAARLQPLLADLVGGMMRAVLAVERRDAAALLPLAAAALAEVATDEAATLVAHPDTLAGLAAHLPGVATAADPTLAPGSFCVSGPDFIVPVDLDQRLARVLEGRR